MDNDRVKFVVDKANGAVIAEINNTMFDALYLVNRKFVQNATSGIEINVGSLPRNPQFEMNTKYKAVARLRPGDEWDEERGKEIARNKLTEVYHNGVNKRLANYSTYLRKIADNIDAYLAKQHN